jgi:hypothetical protein
MIVLPIVSELDEASLFALLKEECMPNENEKAFFRLFIGMIPFADTENENLRIFDLRKS